MAEGGRLYVGPVAAEEIEVVRQVAREQGLHLVSLGAAEPVEESIQAPAILLLPTTGAGPNAYELARCFTARRDVQVILAASPWREEQVRDLCRVNRADFLVRPITPSTLGFLVQDLVEEMGRDHPGSRIQEVETELDRDRLAAKVLQGLQEDAGAGGGIIHRLIRPETGLFLRDFMEFRLEEERKRAIRFKLPLSLVMLAFEGPEGESGGPPPIDLLLGVAGRLLTETRDIDSLGHWGEDSLMLLLPGTPVAGGRAMMDRVFPDVDPLLDEAGRCRIAAAILPAAAPGIGKRDALMARVEELVARARQEGAGEEALTRLAWQEE